MTYRLHLSAVALAMATALPSQAGAPATGPAPMITLAQTFEGAEDPNFNDDGSRNSQTQNSNQASAATTAFIAGFLDLIEENCRPLEAQYRIGCLAAETRTLADRMPKRGDYAQAQKAVDKVAKELEKITKSARDRRQPRIRVAAKRPDGTRENTAPITAIKVKSTPAAVQKAEKAIQAAQITLLRSAPPGDPRESHYQEISTAFDGAAVLLRSI